MRYIVVFKDQSAIYSPQFSFENHWRDGIFCVIDTAANLISFGENWLAISLIQMDNSPDVMKQALDSYADGVKECLDFYYLSEIPKTAEEIREQCLFL